MKGLVAKAFLAAGFLPLLAVAAPAVTPVAPGDDASKLVDGDISDVRAWRGLGDKVVLDFNLSKPEKIARVRIHPGMRCFAAMPSTEGGPKELRVLGKTAEGFVPLLAETVKLPRDPQVGDDFYIDIDLPGNEVGAIRLDILSGHDGGFRMDSPDKSSVPPEKRSMNIREVRFFTAEDVAAEQAKRRERFLAASLLVEKFSEVTKNASPLGDALKSAWGDRIAELEQQIGNGNDADQLWRNFRYLDRQITPYLDAAIEKGSGQVALTLRPEAGTLAGTPIRFPVNFPLIEAFAGKTLSRYRVSVEALRPGAAEKVVSNLYPLTPDRFELVWNLTGADAYRVSFFPASDGETPAMRRLVGNGDQLMQNRFAEVTLPGKFWNVRFRDVFGDGKLSLAAGHWTDYAHIYRNRGSAGAPKFNEFEHYLARDPFDEPISTAEHHGLAFSVVESVDFDGDGKLDLFLARHNNAMPIFVRSIAKEPGSIDYALPVPVQSLGRGCRFAYGDLDGDRIADAVGVRLVGKRVEVITRRGLGLDAKGTPRFAARQLLALEIPDSTETSRTATGCTPTISLDDLNRDGKLDLSISVPPHLYVFFNEGSREKFVFGARTQVTHANGTNFANDFYFPNFGWADIDADGVPDLFCRTANFYYPGVGLAKIADQPKRLVVLTKQLELTDNYQGLGSFDIVDLDGKGELTFCQVDSAMNFVRFRYRDGMFSPLPPVRLEPAGAQRYGCPDNVEYGALYSQIRMADFDGDGRPDVLLNTEHNWRMGYFSLYLNKGDGKFGPEIRLAPKVDAGHLKTVPSPSGKALEVTAETSLDYLSTETADVLSPEAGKIEFSFASKEDGVPGIGRTFFSSSFWDRERYTPRTLCESYRRCKTLPEFLAANPGFSLTQLPDGVIRCQIGEGHFDSAPVALAKGEWHKFALAWDARGSTLELDGKRIAHSPLRPERFADRLHLGSMAWLAVQYFREYPARRTLHPVDFSTPAEGWFDDLKITGADGKAKLKWDFAEDFGALVARSTLAYRCCPGVVGDFRGNRALIAHFDDNRRTEMPGAKARLYAVPFTPKPGQAPEFGEPVPLSFADGTPFYAHTRTVVTPYDWNKDGAIDLILSTENYANKYNIGVELFLNDGKWNFIRTSDMEIRRLNELLTAHHDIKLGFAKLTGAAEPDIVVWTDPGIRAYSRKFLACPEPKATVQKMEY